MHKIAKGLFQRGAEHLPHIRAVGLSLEKSRKSSFRREQKIFCGRRAEGPLAEELNDFSQRKSRTVDLLLKKIMKEQKVLYPRKVEGQISEKIEALLPEKLRIFPQRRAEGLL